MRKSLKSRLVATVAALSLATTPVLAQETTIAVFTKNHSNPFFQVLRLAADKAGAALGVKIVHYIPTKPDSIPEQLSQLEDVITKRPSALVFMPVDYVAMVPGIEKVNKAGIPIVNVTDRLKAGNTVSFVGANDYSLGLLVAEALLNKLGGKGNVIIIEGVKGSITNTDRVRGFNDGIKKFPGVKLLASQPGNYQRLQALQVTENLLQSHPQIDGVLAANDAMGIGAIEALEGAGRKALVVSINGTKEAIDAIKAGKLLASSDYNGFIQGCLGVQIAVRHLAGKPVPKEIMLKPVVIDATNYQPYDVPPEKRNCQTWEEAVAAGVVPN